MIKSRVLAGLAILALSATSLFAEGKACCAAGMKTTANATSAQCVSLANLKLSSTQKTKLQAWENECMKAGCTKASHEKFLSKAKGVLSAEQYATLQKECESMMPGKKV